MPGEATSTLPSPKREKYNPNKYNRLHQSTINCTKEGEGAGTLPSLTRKII